MDLLGEYNSEDEIQESSEPIFGLHSNEVTADSTLASTVLTAQTETLATDALQSPIGFASDSEIHPHLASLPPASIGPFDQHLVQLMQEYQANPSQGMNLIQNIVSNKSFGNPSLLKKITDHFEIDQFGSNFETTKKE